MIIETGIIRICDGVEERIVVESHRAFYPYEHTVKRVVGKPTKKGMASAAYRRIKHQLGDDWHSDLTDCWYEDSFSLDQLEAIDRILNELS